MVGTMDQYNHTARSKILLKTRAQDYVGKTYWIYPTEEVVDHFEKKHVLEIRPSVFALFNREVIEAL